MQLTWPQVLIFQTSNDAGLANRLQAMVSAALFAIVTKRLFLIDWAENTDPLVTPPPPPSPLLPDALGSTPAPVTQTSSYDFQSMAFDERVTMPPMDAIFTPVYRWSAKEAHTGNVQRALSSGSRGKLNFNGHAHRGGDNKGGCVRPAAPRTTPQLASIFELFWIFEPLPH